MFLSIKSIYLSYPSISLGATAVGSPAIVKYINPEYVSSTGSLDSTSTSTATATTTTDVVEKEEGIHGMDLLSVEDIKDIEALPPDSSSNNSNNTTTTSTENNTTKVIIETWSTTWSPKEWPKEWFQNIDSSESVII